MKLKVNGAEHDHRGSGTVADLLKELNAPAERVAVMVNGQIIPKSDYGACRVHEDDGVEVLSFVGGG